MVLKLTTYFKLLVFIVSITGVTSQSQTVIIREDNLELKFIKSKKARTLFNSSSVSSKEDGVQKIRIKLKMNFLHNRREFFDPNKLSLIHYKSQLRYRPTDALFQNMTDEWHFTKVSKEKPKIKTFMYAPRVRDTYLDYDFEGIRNVEIPVNYNTDSNPDVLVTHFKPKKLKSRSIYFFFIVPSTTKQGTLYYGKTKVADISIE